MSSSDEPFDVIVIGGSYAGLSAALQLARARRWVLVIDAGEPRNEVAEHSHGFLGRDGAAPGQISAQARDELLAYPSVQWQEGRAVQATAIRQGFEVHCASGERFEGRHLVLAYGVRDELPEIEGLAERWGRSVFHCPYCHGYEIAGGRIGVVSCSPDGAAQQALLLTDWGQVTLFRHPDEDEDIGELGPRLAERGVAVERSAVQRISGTATLELGDGRSVEMDALFISPPSRLSSNLAEQLGCGLEDGGCITTDAAKQTTVDGVFACGDAARMAGSIALAVGEGALAGVAAHRSLLGLLER
ncbi:MAG TPA: NAD(P)/FAD-dependent oxidoreductase [Stenotrophomonas sp.]|nr:NAD(P)/FAD-dependent oxidoreductase [Stenotrophomonas sp.]